MSSTPPSRPPRLPPNNQAHVPLVPSGLSQSHAPGSSPETERGFGDGHGDGDGDGHEASSMPNVDVVDGAGIVPRTHSTADTTELSSARPVHGIVEEPEDYAADATATLMESYNHHQLRACGCEGPCEHGAWSPRAGTMDDTSAHDGASTSSKTRMGTITADIRERLKSTRGSLDMGSLLGGRQRDATRSLAEQHGVNAGSRMYLGYYFPFLVWIRQYRWHFFQGDFVAALTMASFYIPMALSYAENLAHVPPINGLYSFAFNPLIYAFLGTVPQMVVGPEAAGSLLVGTVVRSSVSKGHSGEDEGMMHARIAGVVTGMSGAIILIAGLSRLGFLENVLSRPFLRGFISAIGIVIFVGQLIPEMGLAELAHDAGVDHDSSWNQLDFLVRNISKASGPTCAVAFTSFAIIMICRETKSRMQPKRPWVAYIPDRFIVVVLSAVFAYAFNWADKGIEILGEVRSTTGSPFPAHFPFVPSYMIHVREAMSTSFLIALLGFFESSVAAKSLGGPEKLKGEGIRGIQHSPNRELVALGVANILGGCFMALPAFGGYGRSKVNASTGGKTPMSSILLSVFTILTVLFLLPFLYYIPKAVLSAMVSVVAYSLIEECPHDIRFFLKIRGWQELALMFMIFFATIFYSLSLGIALGMGLSLLRVIRHSTKPRIQILGKVPGSANRFESAEANPHDVEFIEGSLIVKIPEPLTFANTGDLRNRLRRLERYGTMLAHPALPRVREPAHNQNIVFDVHGVTSLDGAGAQVLAEIVAGYVDAGVRVFFSRVPNPRHPVFQLFVRSGIVEKVGGLRHFVLSVEEALHLAAETQEEAAFRDQEEAPV